MKAPYLASKRAVALLSAPRARRSFLIAWGSCLGASILAGSILRATPENLLAGPNGIRALGWPLESSFVLSTMLALVLCFRAWERMFPAHVPSLYTLYPLRSSAVLSRELQGLLRDAICALTILVGWQLPSWILLRASQIGYALFYALVATLVMSALAYGTPVIFVRSALRTTEPSTKIRASQVAANSAPALSFGVTVSALLLLKLGVEEVARALEFHAMLPTLVKNFRAQEAWLTKSAVVALCTPLAVALGVLVYGLVLRLRHWLSDSMRIAAAMVITPELSYAWIDAEHQRTGHASPGMLLYRRDVVRIQRAAPFRLWLVGGAALLTTLIALFGAPLTRWVALGIFASWILLWMRVPDRVQASWSTALREWDQLLVDVRTIHRSRTFTMARVIAPYGALLLVPALVYSLWSSDWLPLVFTAAWCFALIAHAAYCLRQHNDV